MQNSVSNSPNSPNQPPDTRKEGTNPHVLSRARKQRHYLTLADAESVATLVALRASETEACAALNIPRSTWAHWKQKHAVQFDEMFQRIRGLKLEAHLKNVEAFAAKDWRASIAYLEKTMPEKYSTKIEVAAPTSPPSVSVNVLLSLKEKAYGIGGEKPVEIAASVEPKQIENAKP
jgi:hypothetical protein